MAYQCIFYLFQPSTLYCSQDQGHLINLLFLQICLNNFLQLYLLSLQIFYIFFDYMQLLMCYLQKHIKQQGYLLWLQPFPFLCVQYNDSLRLLVYYIIMIMSYILVHLHLMVMPYQALLYNKAHQCYQNSFQILQMLH